MSASPTAQLQPAAVLSPATQPSCSPAGRKVSFNTASPENLGTACAGRKAAAAAAAADSSESGLPAGRVSYNRLFSPSGPARQDSWTIEAQHAEQAMDPPSSAAGSVAPLPSSTPADEASPLGSLLSGAGGPYTPASATYLESARKVDDLRDRLESLEAALREMESKAVAQLDKSLQDKVLATAAKIVQKRFLADRELDRKLQEQILKTAIKVVNRRQLAAAVPGAGAGAQAEKEAVGSTQEETADPTRRLEFGQAEVAAQVQEYVAHVEQGMGEVVRRLEKKVDAVAALLDQNALELLEARVAGGLVQLEARLDAVEEATLGMLARRPPAEDGSARLLERVAAVEAAMAEQSRAVGDLLAALGKPGLATSQQAAAAVASVQAAAAGAAPVSVWQEGREVQGQEAAPAAPAEVQQAPTVDAPARAPEPQAEPIPPAAQLIQRRAAAARRSALGDPLRSARGGADGGGSGASTPRRPALPRLKPVHSAGTAQQIAIATARQQLARQAARAAEEAEAESPAWLSALYVFGWGLLVVLGLLAVLMGMVAALIKAGRLTEADLAFLWEAPNRR